MLPNMYSETFIYSIFSFFTILLKATETVNTIFDGLIIQKRTLADTRGITCTLSGLKIINIISEEQFASVFHHLGRGNATWVHYLLNPLNFHKLQRLYHW